MCRLVNDKKVFRVITEVEFELNIPANDEKHADKLARLFLEKLTDRKNNVVVSRNISPLPIIIAKEA